MPDFTTWLIERGVSEDIILITVFIPVFVTLTVFVRYVTGIKTFGIYAGMVLSFAFLYMGFIQGFATTILVILSSWAIRNALRQVRIHYLARLAIVYCGDVMLVLAFIVALSFIPIDNPYLDFTQVPPLPFFLIMTVTDRFVASYDKKDLTTALRLTGETLIIAVVGWAIMRWDITRRFFMFNLWTIPVLLSINVLIGQYAGLRWTEFIRFNQVIRNVELPEDDQKK